MLNVFEDVVEMVPPNVVDKWFLSLIGQFEGWGMVLYVLLTLLISGVLCGIIGLERYKKGASAGMTTHALLSVGASFLMTISVWAIKLSNAAASYDVSRIAAGAITGIGFLGAGVIIKDKFTVKGLSTAATLWVCASIGLATGAGFVLEAVIGAIVALFIIFIKGKVVKIVNKHFPQIEVRSVKGYPSLKRLREICENPSINLKGIDIVSIDDKETVTVVYFAYRANPLVLDYFISEIKKEKEVIDAVKR